MNVTNAIRLYLRIYQNNYLHLKKVKYNQNLQDWHYVQEDYGQFYLVHNTLINYKNSCDDLISPYFEELSIADNEVENYFWNIFNAFDRMFYINGGGINGKFSSMDNRTRLFIALANDADGEKLRLSLIKRLLANCFIDSYSVNYLKFSKNTLYFQCDNQKIAIRDFIQNWQGSYLSSTEDIQALKVLQNYYLSLLNFLENGLEDSFFNHYCLPTHIAPQGKRIKLAKIDLMDIYPHL